MARKTTTSSEVKTRWIKENYKIYRVSLRYDTDKELIDFIEQAKQKNDGFGVTDIFREALNEYMQTEK